MAERSGLLVDHDRAAAGEDERERPDRLRDQGPRQRGQAQVSDGSSSPISAVTRCVELVADPADGLDVLPGRVVELPVLVLLARIDRAGVAAAHRDHDVRRGDDLVGQRLRELLTHVDAELGHRLDHGRVDLLARGAAGRADMDPPLRAELHQACSHLATAGVVDTDEQDLGLLLHDHSLGLPQRLEALAGEAVNQHRHEDVDLAAGEKVGRLDDVTGDRLLREDAGELALQRLGRTFHVLARDRIQNLHTPLLHDRLPGHRRQSIRAA